MCSCRSLCDEVQFHLFTLSAAIDLRREMPKRYCPLILHLSSPRPAAPSAFLFGFFGVRHRQPRYLLGMDSCDTVAIAVAAERSADALSQLLTRSRHTNAYFVFDLLFDPYHGSRTFLPNILRHKVHSGPDAALFASTRCSGSAGSLLNGVMIDVRCFLSASIEVCPRENGISR